MRSSEVTRVEGYERIRPEGISTEGAQNLVEAIVKRAVEDWRVAAEAQKKAKADRANGRRLECERFFRSGYFFELTGLDGEALLKKLKKQEGIE